MVTIFLLARAANSAASLTRFARSAPENLVDQVCQIRAGETRGTARDDHRIDVFSRRYLAHMYFKNMRTTAYVGQRHHHLAVESTGAQQGRVEHVWPVCGGDDDNAFVAFETVHFHQQLVQRLLAFIVTAAEAGAAMTPDGIDFVDEDDAGRMFLGLVEHITYARGADTDEHFDEVGAGNCEKRHLGFTRDGFRQQGFTGTGRTDHQHAARNLAAEFLELGRVAQEFDQFGDLFLGFVDAGDIVEIDVDLVFAQIAPRPLPPPCIWRMKKIHRPISTINGNQLINMCPSNDGGSGGLPRTATSARSRSPIKALLLVSGL
jgi:hypothetical protein